MQQRIQHFIIILAFAGIFAIGVFVGTYIPLTRPTPEMGTVSRFTGNTSIENNRPADVSPSQEEADAERQQMILDLKTKYTKGIFDASVTSVSGLMISGDAMDDEEYSGKVSIVVKQDEENGTLIARQTCESAFGCKREVASLGDISVGKRILVYLAHTEDGSVAMEGNTIVAQYIVIEE